MPTEAKLTEKELWLLLKQKSASAFSYLYDEYAPLIYGTIVREVKNPQLASDILKNTFINIVNECNHTDCIKSSLFSWMLQLTRTTAIQEFRTSLDFSSLISQGVSQIQPVKNFSHA